MIILKDCFEISEVLNVNAELKDRSSSEVESLKKEVMADTFTKSDTENKEVEQK